MGCGWSEMRNLTAVMTVLRVYGLPARGEATVWAGVNLQACGSQTQYPLSLLENLLQEVHGIPSCGALHLPSSSSCS